MTGFYCGAGLCLLTLAASGKGGRAVGFAQLLLAILGTLCGLFVPLALYFAL
ncbi:hypothetical protein KIM372_11180 [Bombiscardovia nodaiensis]|uniref:Uncharacterized protein n=1 Tax=Bombiscardovia nodaiensis TaxID=2932181 RepID=A0ABN6SEH9_9BIFI|nr:hypothetical protein KIM372_11180 [Bombiscardovia nodaiensis]